MPLPATTTKDPDTRRSSIINALVAEYNSTDKPYNVRSFKGKDDDSVIAAAIAAAPAGGTVYFPPGSYNITAAISVTKSLNFVGPFATIFQATANTPGFSVTASNVTLDGLTLQGPVSATYQANGAAINASGTMNAGLAPTNISNLTVKDCTIKGWGAYGIFAAYLDGFLFLNNGITDVGYAGIGVLSGINGRVGFNKFDTVGPGSAGNAYGVYFSRATGDSGELTSQPRSADITCIGNDARNIPLWEAYDTHGGERIAFIGNTSYNTKIGIQIGTSLNASNVDTYAPLKITAVGNTLDSGVSNGSASFGITVHGVLGGAKATGSVGSNTTIGFGDQTNLDNGSAYYFYATSGLSFTGNAAINPSWMGFCIYSENEGFSGSGNAVVDAWTNNATVSEVVAFCVRSSTNVGFLGGNTDSTNGLSATYLLTTSSGKGIYIVAGTTGNAITLGPYTSAATNPLIDTVFAIVPPRVTPLGYPVASLGTGALGMMARVTDGTSGLAWGATVTGGHSTPYLVWFNGTNWTVAGS